MLTDAGAELVIFSPLHDRELPADLDGIYLGGGYPEAFAEALSENRKMLEALKRHGASKAVYAECAGMMLLCRSLETLEGKRHALSGLLPAETRMRPRRKALGYVTVETLADGPLGPRGTRARGHEFHYSELTARETSCPPCYRLEHPVKKNVKLDGFSRPLLQSGYAHLHFASNPQLPENLVNFAFRLREKRREGASA
jgi:cobyrinic acid a,c-diamide synthase